MSEILDKTSGNKPARNDRGQILPGYTGNPDGRPKGTVSITTKIKQELASIPEGQKKTFLELLVRKILKKAVIDGDVVMIKQIWNYVDGMPQQSLELSGGLKTTEEKITKLDDTELDAILQRIRAEIAQGEKPKEGADRPE